MAFSMFWSFTNVRPLLRAPPRTDRQSRSKKRHVPTLSVKLRGSGWDLAEHLRGRRSCRCGGSRRSCWRCHRRDGPDCGRLRDLVRCTERVQVRQVVQVVFFDVGTAIRAGIHFLGMGRVRANVPACNNVPVNAIHPLKSRHVVRPPTCTLYACESPESIDLQRTRAARNRKRDQKERLKVKRSLPHGLYLVGGSSFWRLLEAALEAAIRLGCPALAGK